MVKPVQPKIVYRLYSEHKVISSYQVFLLHGHLHTTGKLQP